MKVGITGRYVTDNDKAVLHGVAQAIHENNNIEVLDNREEVANIKLNNDISLYDDLFDSTLDSVERADVFVVVTPKMGEEGHDMVGWFLAYCWSHGIPVVLVSLNEVKLSKMVARSVHAHLTSFEELESYDFHDIPVKAFLGELIGG